MSYTLIRENEINGLIYDDQHVTIFCLFTVGDNNTPVDVDNPTFRIYKEQTEVPIQLLRPLQKDNRLEQGKYIVTFLSSNLQPDIYTCEFSGKYNNTEIKIEKTIELREVPRLQNFIEMLRGLMMAKYNLDVPRMYMTFDPTKKQWEDYDLYVALVQSLNVINEINPVTDWKFEDIPCPGLLMLGAQIYALTEVRTLEELNYFDITVPTKVSFYRGDKLANLANFIMTQFTNNVKDYKMNYYLDETEPVAVVMRRIPTRILRPISDNLHFHSLAY